MKKIIILLALLGIACACASAEQGTADRTITLPDNVTTIGDQSFADCAGIEKIIIPDSVTTIGEDIISKDVVIVCSRESTAAQWAYENGYTIEYLEDVLTLDQTEVAIKGSDALTLNATIRPGTMQGSTILWSSSDETVATVDGQGVVTAVGVGSTTITAQIENTDYTAECALTVLPSYRALIIGNTYKDTYAELNGTENDARGVDAMLRTMDAEPYSIDLRIDSTKSDSQQAIDAIAAQAIDGDVTLFYYAGHGLEGGALYANDERTIGATTLRTWLDTIKGSKIVVIDACHSGGNVRSANNTETAAEIAQAEMEAFTEDFISAFASFKTRSLAADGYYVLCACAADEYSQEVFLYQSETDKIIYCGLFTYYFLRGCGWDEVNNVELSEMYADTDDNGMITLKEIYTYTYDTVDQYLTKRSAWNWQTASCYPEDSAYPLFGQKQS